jgi:F-type H+-transporting ATPase subunit b
MLNRVIFCLMLLAVVFAMAVPAWASDAPAGEGDMNPLSLSAVKGDMAVWTTVVFLCILAVLTKFAWKPLAEGLDKRESHITGQISQAEDANRQAKELLSGYEAKLADVEEKVRAIHEQGRRDAEQVGRDMIEKAKEEAKAEHDRALQQIEAATSAAIKELADRSALLAVELAGKIVHAKLNPTDHAKLIEQAVAGFIKNPKDVTSVSRN